MTDDRSKRLADIAGRVEAATPGPWSHGGGLRFSVTALDEDDTYIATTESERDAAFIAHARSDVPWLLSELARVEAERQWLLTEVRAVGCSQDAVGALESDVSIAVRDLRSAVAMLHERVVSVEAALAESEAARVALRDAAISFSDNAERMLLTRAYDGETKCTRCGAGTYTTGATPYHLDDCEASPRALDAALSATPADLAARVRARHRAEAFRDAAERVAKQDVLPCVGWRCHEEVQQWLRALAIANERSGR